ncbi:hypothetical protein SAMN05444366_2257 [Flavobacterium saccharophilum]|uniref:Uncharacterized protein n=1 Tax=Flavobacterium saccharophilum TaxID=29534 RepID=A0A1M7FTN7_9FLAO|nr:hypothetical protein SAMN05444366_2257 [Flavobacterium saccharophilum]
MRIISKMPVANRGEIALGRFRTETEFVKKTVVVKELLVQRILSMILHFVRELLFLWKYRNF